MVLKSLAMCCFVVVILMTANLSAQDRVSAVPVEGAKPLDSSPSAASIWAAPVSNGPAFSVQQEKPVFLTADPSNECPILEENDFIKLAKIVEIKSCYENKQSYKNAKDPNIVDNISLLKSDHAICNCLREKAKVNDLLKRVMLAEKDQLQVLWSNDESRKKVIETTQTYSIRKRQDLAKKQKELPFQASIIFNGNPVLTTAYKNDFANKMMTELVSEVNSKHEKLSEGQLTTFQKNKLEFSKGLADAKLNSSEKPAMSFAKAKQMAMENVSRPEDLLKDPEKLAEGQCVSGREFLAYKQLPSNPLIFESLAGKKDEFNEKDWDFNALKSQYSDLMDRPEHEKKDAIDKIRILREKISYLNKNPMIREIFSTRSDFSYYKGFLESQNEPVDKQKKLEEMISNQLLPKKKELFEIIKKMNLGNSCKEEASVCLKRAFDGNILDEYKKGLRSFFVSTEPAIGELVLLNSQAETYEDLKDYANGKKKKYKNQSALTQKNVMKDFFDRTGLDPDSCTREGSDPAVCAQIYSLYCKKMDAVMVEIGSQSLDPELQDNLETRLAFDFEPDIETNEELKKFNADLCLTKIRKSSKDKTDKGMSFFEYKKKNCSENEKMLSCRSKFIAEYKASVPNDFTNFSNIVTKEPVVSVKTPRDVFTSVPGNKVEARNWKKMRSSMNLPANESLPQATAASSFTKKANGSSFAQDMSNFTNSIINPSSDQTGESQAAFASSKYNYGSGQNALANGPQKVENMNEEQKQNLLHNWKKEYEDLKSDQNKTSEYSAQESATKAKIEALEQLLAQQKKITEDQSKLLNEAISRQGAYSAPKTQRENTTDTETAKNHFSSKSNASGADHEEIFRNPASVKEFNQPNGNKTASQGSSSSGQAASRSRQTSALASSSDSVAREEAKLVNLRRFGDGSITLEPLSVNPSGRAAQANAISLVVSDDNYRLISLNPTGLNLKELEKDIPKDLIKKLEKDGEITIILSNRTNPPFEVKVEKKNNQLVYRVKDDKGDAIIPVKRVYTREALEYELKAQK